MENISYIVSLPHQKKLLVYHLVETHLMFLQIFDGAGERNVPPLGHRHVPQVADKAGLRVQAHVRACVLSLSSSKLFTQFKILPYLR